MFEIIIFLVHIRKINIIVLLAFISLFVKAEVNTLAIPDNKHETEFIFDKTFFQKDHTLAELQTIIDQFDTYDYVRTKNQKEELVRYLLNEFSRYEYKLGIAKCENILGVLLRDKAEYAKAIELHNSALNHAPADTLLQIYSLNNLGVVYRRLDKPRIALDYHMDALTLAEKYEGDLEIAKRSACVALNSIGNINLVLNQPERALNVFYRTLEMERALKNKLGMAINYQNIGFCYEELNDLSKALSYYNKSLEENKKINSDVGRSICHNSIGEVYLKQDRPYEALEAFKIAQIFAEITTDNYYISQTHANIGKSYLELGIYDEALKQFELFKDIAKTIKSPFLVQSSHELLSDYYQRIGQYDSAFFEFKAATAINDSILNEKNARYLNEIQTIYDTDKKQQQIELLTIENKVRKQRYLFYIFAALSLVLVVLVLFIISRRRSEKRNQELEARLFRSLMNPHFLFNALGSIQNFLYKNEADKAAIYLGNFSKLTRAILQNSNKELITLEEELSSLKNYIEIEQMRHNNCFTYSINYDEDLELDFIFVLPTMIQPFVENGILHGLSGMPKHSGVLTINIEQLKNHVKIEIQDNGKGIKAAILDRNNPKHKSMGMNIFKERVRIIERKYKKSVNFGVEDMRERDPSKTGTIVTIEFPLIEPND